MVEKFFFLSGLPRAGSTLFSALVAQNPEFHAEGNSALCQLMWDMQQSCRTTSNEQLRANNKFDKMQGMLCATLPYMYYEGVQTKYVLDKCRSWTLSDNMQMLADYLNVPAKVIVLVRPVEDIVRSFMQLNIDNGRDNINPEDMLAEWSEPVMRSYNGVMHAKGTNDGKFLFIDYDKLVSNPDKQLERAYVFLGVPKFAHSFVDIENKHPENDMVYGLLGQHDIRSTVEKRNLAYVLPEEIALECKKLTATMYADLDIGD